MYYVVNLIKNGKIIVTTRHYETRLQAYDVQSNLFNYFMFENDLQFEIEKRED